MSLNSKSTIARILKVNHAGETGAIRIYEAQVFISRHLNPEIVPILEEMLGHEIEHCRIFLEAMPSRDARPCRAMWMWGLGGWMLGTITALMGKKYIWVCTEAVEQTVHQHLEDQLRFLANRDVDLYEKIKSIQVEELAHLEQATNNIAQRNNLAKFIRGIVVHSTELVIWLSTQGDSSRMSQEIKN